MLNCEIDYTNHSIEVARFLNSGNLKCVGFFIIVGKAIKADGVWIALDDGEIIGNPQGENYFSCFICGHDIDQHISIKNLNSGRILNVGIDCYENLIDEPKAKKIKKAVESIRRNIRKIYMAKIHRQQLVEFLESNMTLLSEKRVKLVESLLASDPHYFWLPKTKTVNGIDIPRTLWEQNSNAEKDMLNVRDYWQHQIDVINSFSGSMSDCRDVLQKKITNDGFALQVPQLRKLTSDEQTEVSRNIVNKVQAFLDGGEQ